MVRRLLATGAALALGAVASPTAGEESVPPGWAGADLKAAQAEASRTGRPVLAFVRSTACPPCDRAESWLTSDPEVVALTEPFIRLRIQTGEPEGAVAAALLNVISTPAVVILGPGGMEATRSEGRLERAWLTEKLLVLARRHAPGPAPAAPTDAELAASRQRLVVWGDLEGAAAVDERLDREAGLSPRADSPAAGLSLEEVRDLLSEIADPARLRRTAHDLALDLEAAARPGLALAAYHEAVRILERDPLSEARAGFLAARQGLSLERIRRRLVAARSESPESVPLLMALARVAEQSNRLYQAYHAAEAAAAYEPEDAWIAMEHRRLQLLVRLSSRKSERDPT